MICDDCAAPRARINHCGELNHKGRIRVKHSDTKCECHCREWRLWEPNRYQPIKVRSDA